MLVPVFPKMRGIKEAIAELKKLDPETNLTEYRLRKLVNSGEIPCHIAGGKKLINFDEMCRILAYGNEQPEQEAPKQSGTIRKIML